MEIQLQITFSFELSNEMCFPLFVYFVQLTNGSLAKGSFQDCSEKVFVMFLVISSYTFICAFIYILYIYVSIVAGTL